MAKMKEMMKVIAKQNKDFNVKDFEIHESLGYAVRKDDGTVVNMEQLEAIVKAFKLSVNDDKYNGFVKDPTVFKRHIMAQMLGAIGKPKTSRWGTWYDFENYAKVFYVDKPYRYSFDTTLEIVKKMAKYEELKPFATEDSVGSVDRQKLALAKEEKFFNREVISQMMLDHITQVREYLVKRYPLKTVCEEESRVVKTIYESNGGYMWRSIEERTESKTEMSCHLPTSKDNRTGKRVPYVHFAHGLDVWEEIPMDESYIRKKIHENYEYYLSRKDTDNPMSEKELRKNFKRIINGSYGLGIHESWYTDGDNPHKDKKFRDIYTYVKNIERESNKVLSAKTYRDVANILECFIYNYVETLNVDYGDATPNKSKSWWNAFKARGSYYTIMNIVLTHSNHDGTPCCIFKDEDGKIKDEHGKVKPVSRYEAWNLIRAKEIDYFDKDEMWRWFSMLKGILNDNDIDLDDLNLNYR